MIGNIQILIPILLPIILGVAVILMKNADKVLVKTVFISALLISIGFAISNCFTEFNELQLGYLTGKFLIMFRVDELSIYFSCFTSAIWIFSAIYTCKYIEHEENQSLFLGMFLMIYGVLIALDYSANLVTMYLFYELTTLLSAVLVIHSRTKEAISAGLKYILYSLIGAFMGLICIFFVDTLGGTTEFIAGGSIVFADASKEILLVVAFLGLLGFGTKAGIFPLYDWLPTAHPVAPAPASAVLSGVIAKCGVLASIRLVYYVFGADFLRGEWVQTAWTSLALITVLLGSVMAYREKILKKRLAYSTVSQVSYILFGLSLLDEQGFSGAMLHVVGHGFVKVALFLCAGAIIFKTHITNTDELKGIGKKMPVLMFSFTAVSLSLVGIPPFAGFVSKFMLIEGALASQANAILCLSGAVVLLISAILTAGYLLSISYNAFYCNEEDVKKIHISKKSKSDLLMYVPIAIMAVMSLLLGVFSTNIMSFVENMTASIF